MRLSKKLIFSFIFTILISILIISSISNIMINKRFENFLVSEREDKFERIHMEINNLLINNDSLTNDNLILNEMDFIHYALSENINLIIKDNNDKTILSTNNSMRMGGMMGQGRMHRMRQIPQGKYVEKSYPLKNNDMTIGTLIIGYIDNSYLTESALIFKSTLTQSIVVSGIFAILIGLIISIGISRNLTKPILTIMNVANEIREGDFSSKVAVNTNTTEIVDLSKSINYLGSSLSQQEEIRKRYASDISHELRTPITTLRTHLEAIIDGVWEPTNEHLNILMEEIIRLSNLTDNLKETFRQEEFSNVLNKSKFNISNELKDIVTAFLPLFNKENYILESKIDENIEGTLDKDKFKQITNNLLSNSIRYLNENGTVTVVLKKIDNRMFLTVKDNGVGISPLDLPHIFDRFYRVDTSRNKITGGSGLGLSIVKSIVESHNGTIKVNSQYGEGTEFEINLPLNELRK